MKLFPAFCLSMLLALPAMAQDAHEASIRFKKEDRNGVVATYDAPKEATEDALEQTLKTSNLGKQRHESGFWKYEAVTWPEISPNTIDVFFDVDRHKGKSVVSMLVSLGNGNFVTSATNPQVIDGMKAFLTRFAADVVARQQALAVAAQQKAVEEANHDLRKADRATDRAARRQEKADREKARKQEQVGEQNKKLEELQQPK